MNAKIPDLQTSVLNGICPYFTMFPLNFPYRILREHAEPGETVMDPFCGRGTTLYAARLLGISAYGIDSSLVAVAITRAKLAQTTPDKIAAAARHIITNETDPECPEGEFWEWAYSPGVLRDLCRLRAALLRDASSCTRQALIGLILGALHGPIPKSGSSYFSNQCTRTFAPKPAYAVKFWKTRNLCPPEVNVLSLIRHRAEHFFGSTGSMPIGYVTHGDSRTSEAFASLRNRRCDWVITSPPYYGMRTYLPDQWLRLWFLGGPPQVNYSNNNQVNHRSPESFAAELQKVWQNTAEASRNGCRLVIRFGAINDRNVNAMELIKSSLYGTTWKINTVKPAGTASTGRRQALHFSNQSNPALTEFDVWAVKTAPRHTKPIIKGSVS